MSARYEGNIPDELLSYGGKPIPYDKRIPTAFEFDVDSIRSLSTGELIDLVSQKGYGPPYEGASCDTRTAYVETGTFAACGFDYADVLIKNQVVLQGHGSPGATYEYSVCLLLNKRRST